MVIIGNLKSQGTFINKDFEENSGYPLFNPILNPLGIEWSKSILASGGTGIITTGYTSVSGQGQNILLTKYDPDGNLIFNVNYNSSSSFNDYGSGVYEAANGDILVCGTTDNGGSSDYDIVVLRYSSSGTLLNTSIQDGPAGKNDFAVSIIEDGIGNIIVAANTEAMNGFYDYFALMFNGTLSLINTGSYDYTSLNDIALGMEFSSSGDVCLIGASASGTNACDYAMATFDGSSLAFLSDTRNNIPGTALDQAHAYAKDASGNMYITGKAWNGSNFDIKTIKIASNLSISWTATLNPNGMDDCAFALCIDPVTNDVVVGGYATRTNNLKELVFVRYNSSNGSVIHTYKKVSENPTGDAFIKKIVSNNAGEFYFIAGEKGISGFNQTLVGKIKTTDVISWFSAVKSGGLDILPSDIEVTGSSVYVISVKDSTLNRYITTKFSELELDTSKASYGTGLYKKNELIVRFLPSALDSSRIDDASEFGNLSYYMKPTAYSTVTNALETICRDCEIKAVKIFPGHLTSYTSTSSRLGEEIAAPDFWTALLLVFPPNSNVRGAEGIFNSLNSIAAYAHPNWLAHLFSVPDDSLYNQQHSLQTNTIYPGCDINVEEAWDIVKDGGKPFVRCGVFDTGLDWENVDFGYNGSNPATSKITGGWDHRYPSFAYTPLKGFPRGDANGGIHATAVTGIIGAQRNNNRGIAGIAGGNDSIGSKGISIYGNTIFDPSGGSIFSFTATPLNYITQAMYNAAKTPTQNTWGNPHINSKCFKLNLENLSFGIYLPPFDTGVYANWVETTHLFHEVMYELNRLKVTCVAARGQNNGSNINYPACTDDDWVITVTGTGTDGNFAHNSTITPGPVNAEFTSNWGGPVDIGAPSSGSLITTLSTTNTGAYGSVYNSFGGTSAAAPHVTGVVGLMMSYMNYPDTVDHYTNMAPEDCEAILQMSATDTDSSGYDILTGYGRLNAGKALRLLEKPYYELRHFGTNPQFSHSISKTLVSSNDTIYTTERFERRLLPHGTWYQKGKYIVNTFLISSTVIHNFSMQDTIIAYWPRHSSSFTFPSVVNGKLTPRIKTKIMTMSNGYAGLWGYVYQVKDSTGAPIGWWPVDTSYVSNPMYGNWAEYTILTRNYSNTFPVNINETIENLKALSIFPNPSKDVQNLLVETKKVCDLNIELYDLMGRKIRTIYQGKSEVSVTKISHSVVDLPNSVYIYHIQIDGNKVCRKLIKQ
jgi:hypothetical protein